MKQIKKKLVSPFDMINIGLITFYADLKITHNQTKKIIKLSQPSYIEKLLD